MSHDPILHLLGLARKAGRMEIGEEPVGAICRARQAKLVLLASDAAPNTCRRAAHFGEAGNVLWITLPFTKAELGFALGRSSCAMLALTDSGFAASVLEKLSRRAPEQYGPAAQQLRIKADRALQRQREKRQHEKNLREGKKRKPWTVPSGGADPRPPRKEGGERPRLASSPKFPAKGGAKSAGRPRACRSNRATTGPGGRKLSGKFRHNP